MRKTSSNAVKTAIEIAEFADEKKAEDIVVLDMRKVANFCDYFVLCEGNTDRHVKAIADGIEQGLAAQGMTVRFKEGLKDCMWVIFDIGDVVVHVFHKSAREFYGLEYLWQNAKNINWQKKSKKSV